MAKSHRRATRQITIKDVAEAAGVSVTTVSNVLNGRTEAMAEDTLLRIQETIRTLHYRPSSVARSLVTRRTATIGLILAEIDTPLFVRSLTFIEPVARRAGYNLLLCTAFNIEEEQQAVNLLLEKQVDGIIFLLTSTYREHDYLPQLPASAPPLVLINQRAGHDRFDQINWDNTSGVMGAVEYLARLGHRYIGFMNGPADRHSSKERLAGYRLGLERAGLPYRPDYVRPGDYTEPSATWQRSIHEFLALSPRPTAIIATNDTVAATVLRTLYQAGIRVPQEMTVIGHDDQPFCTYLQPALTTVQLPVIEAGKLAIDMLLARIGGQRFATESLMLPCPLIVRESSREPGSSWK